jgi:hypothetical protein
MGVFCAGVVERIKLASHVSMKEASFYEPLDFGEREEK